MLFFTTTVGTYSCTEGAQYGMPSLHQLTKQMPLLQGSKTQVSKAVEFNVQTKACQQSIKWLTIGCVML